MLILVRDGKRLCQDMRWRNFALYGSSTSCVKTYKSLAAALKMRNGLNAHIVIENQHKPFVQVIEIPKNAHIDASGTVIVEKPDPNKPDYVITSQHKMEEFVIEPYTGVVQNATNS